MSSVIGIVENDRLVMGCDSIYVGNVVDNTTSDKLFRRGPLFIGCTFSPRVRQLIAYEVELPEVIEPDGNLEKTLMLGVVKPIHACMKANDIDERKDGVATQEGHMLIGIHNRLFVVQYDWRVIEPRCKYWAVGSHDGIAMGVLHATRNGEIPAERRIEMALEAQEAHSIYIRPPFVICPY
jgi:hypothetical protein